MEILYFDKLDSTHKYLLRNLKNNTIKPPIMITADEQTDGIGTRGRDWQSLKGNLFLSCALTKEFLPHDIQTQSISIYFAYQFKELLESFGSSVWLKWPNDFYIDDKKIGGILSQKVRDFYIVSIGLNIKKSPENFQIIDISLNKNKIISQFILELKKVPSWKKIFSKYQVEFNKSRAFKATYHDNKKLPLKDAVLNYDGSIDFKER